MYCLLDTLPAAYAAALDFARDEPEPGPYIIFEILRRPSMPYLVTCMTSQ
jgi:hypothetical protein